jgi:hypothetical protein
MSIDKSRRVNEKKCPSICYPIFADWPAALVFPGTQMQASFSALPWIYFGCQWKHVLTAKSCTCQQLYVVLNMLQTYLRWKIASSMLCYEKTIAFALLQALRYNGDNKAFRIKPLPFLS